MQNVQLIGFLGLYRKECVRFFRIWPQALLAPLITITLYFLIFGKFLGQHIRFIEGVHYIAYVTPGLIMLPIIMNSYANIVSSVFIARNNRSLEEILISPLNPLLILLGYTLSSTTRGLFVGLIVTIIGLLMSHSSIAHPFLFIIFAVLTAFLFSLAGLLNGIFARKIDDTAIFSSFILTPLIYLSGIFYSINSLGPVWRHISEFNPVHYITELFHYAFLNVKSSAVPLSLTVIIALIIILFYFNWRLIAKGGGIKT